MCLSFGALPVQALERKSDVPAVAVDSLFQFNDLKLLIEKNDLRALEDVLPLLPKKLKANFTLMHESRSLQAATPENPRAILFNDDGSLVLTFNGHEGQRGGNRIEIMTFEEATARFAVKTIEFSPAKAKPTFDEQPQNCFGCHGRIADDLKPIWDPGLVWRGAYGSRDDSFAMLNDSEMKAEAQSYFDFAATTSTHKRFRSLDFSRPIGGGDRSSITSHPNLRLGLILMRQQAKRVARQLNERAPESLRETLAKVSGCKPTNAEPAFALQISSMMSDFLTPIYGEHFVKGFITTEAPRLIDTFYIGQSLGLDTTEWPLTIEKRSYSIFDGSFPFADLLTTELVKLLTKSDPSFGGVGSELTFDQSVLGLRIDDALNAIDRMGNPLKDKSQLCSKLFLLTGSH